MPTKERDYVYADSLCPVLSVDDIDQLVAELRKPKDRIDLVVVTLGVGGLLRRLQMAENQGRLGSGTRAFFDGLQRVGLHETDAKV